MAGIAVLGRLSLGRQRSLDVTMEEVFERVANVIARAMGRPLTFLLCCALVLVEGEALQAKLDELIRALDAAENRFIGLEQHSEKEIGEMRSEIESSVTQSTVTS
jgi:low affinity Fe/Cu permease